MKLNAEYDRVLFEKFTFRNGGRRGRSSSDEIRMADLVIQEIRFQWKEHTRAGLSVEGFLIIKNRYGTNGFYITRAEVEEFLRNAKVWGKVVE